MPGYILRVGVGGIWASAPGPLAGAEPHLGAATGRVRAMLVEACHCTERTLIEILSRGDHVPKLKCYDFSLNEQVKH